MHPPSPIILPFNGIVPTIHPDAWIAPGAVVIGDVHIGKDSNVWFGCVIRGDVSAIRVGERTNIQDGTVVHVTRNVGPTIIGSDVTIGHQAIIHAATIEDFGFVGMGSIVLDFSIIESYGFLAAGAVLTPKKRLPQAQLWAGNPAKFLRAISKEEREYIPFSAEHYVSLSRKYKD
ncbi:MAG: gamma carbonic anhydrase family protein [Alphaproteobacteria bacterium]|jgi:carbonic anhydrase/acetyltransferase-like protein (isoleucine patch superfamily)|nr:gamma carbonic anhydrase family protein [Rickettsiales bacterium]